MNSEARYRQVSTVRRKITLGVILASLLLGSLWVILYAQRGDRNSTAAISTESMEGTGTAHQAPADPKPAEHAARTYLSQGSDPAGTETAAQTGDAGVHGPTLTIRVVEAASGKTMPDVPVYVVDPEWRTAAQRLADEEWNRRSRAGRVDLRAYMEAIGKRFVSDARGEVRISAGPQYRSATALLGSLEGSLSLPPDKSGTIDLELHPKLSVRVAVVDGTGRAVEGVPVGIVEPHSVRPLAVTNDEGQAVMAIRWPEVEGAPSLDLGICLPISPPVRQRVDRLRIPEEPVVLTLPATGSLQVEVVDESGERLADPLAVLKLVARFQLAGGEWMHVNMESVLVDGVAFLPHVGLGMEFTPAVERGNQIKDSATKPASIHGPQKPGETRRVQVWLGAAQHVAAFRVLDPRGVVLSDTLLTAMLVQDGRGKAGTSRRKETRTLVTDGRGRLRVNLPEILPAGFSRELMVWLPDEEDARNFHAYQAAGRVDLSRSFPAGTTMLEDLVLGEVPLLARGKVTDADGHPLAGARVTGTTSYDTSSGSDFHLGMTPADLDRTFTDDGGRFEIRSLAQAANMRLKAEMDGYYLVEPVTVAIPSGKHAAPAEVHLVMQGAGSIRIDLGDLEGFDPKYLDFYLRRKGGLRVLSDAFAAETTNLRTYPNLQPGTYELTLRNSGLIGDLIREVIPVEAGKESFRRIDLASRLRQFTVTLLDPNLQPMPNQNVWQTRGTGKHWLATTDDRGQARLLGPASGESLLVQAPGYRPIQREGVTSDLTLILEQGIPIAIQVEPMTLEMHGGSFQLSILGTRSDGEVDPSLPGIFKLPVSASGMAEAILPVPGAYTLGLAYTTHRRGQEMESFDLPKELFQPRLIQVQDQSQVQGFRLVLDAAKTAAFLHYRPTPVYLTIDTDWAALRKAEGFKGLTFILSPHGGNEPRPIIGNHVSLVHGQVASTVMLGDGGTYQVEMKIEFALEMEYKTGPPLPYEGALPIPETAIRPSFLEVQNNPPTAAHLQSFTLHLDAASVLSTLRTHLEETRERLRRREQQQSQR